MNMNVVFDLWLGAAPWPSVRTSTKCSIGGGFSPAHLDRNATQPGMPFRKMPAGRIGTSRFKNAFLNVLLGMLVALGTSAQQRGETIVTELKTGDIIYADSGNAIEGGCIIKVDAHTGQQSVISAGGNLIQPLAVTLDDQDGIVVSDPGRCCTLTCIDPATGQQTNLLRSPDTMLGVPFGLAVARDGSVLVANGEGIIRIDSKTGSTGVVASGGSSFRPLGLAVAKNGHLFVLNRTFPNEIIRVHPETGDRTLVSRGGYLNNPQGITVKDDVLYVTDVASSDGNFGIGRVIRVDAQTGAQTVVTEGGNLVGPVGIAVDENEQLVVGDPYTINPASPDLFDGGIVRVDPVSGAQTLIARGSGSFVNPRGLVVVQKSPSPKFASATNLRKTEP